MLLEILPGYFINPKHVSQEEIEKARKVIEEMNKKEAEKRKAYLAELDADIERLKKALYGGADE